jgi:hypothetical protein
MDDRRRIPGGEGSPCALGDRDSSTLAQGVGAGALCEVSATGDVASRRQTPRSTESWKP